MRRGGVPATIAVLALLLASCTTDGDTASTTLAPTPTTPPNPTAAPGSSGALVLGDPLPAGCDRAAPEPDQTVAFVAGGRAWALSTGTGQLSCLFEVTDEGPFAWGPQGDRVLLGDGEVRFLTGDDLAVENLGGAPFAWGRPIGKAIVFDIGDGGAPEKVFMDDGSVSNLTELPEGAYSALAYHPSGLALALSIPAIDDTPQIYLSTNEGKRPKRVVVGVSATAFPSLGFTADGTRLIYLADHKGGFAQVHMIDLTDPEALVNGWRSEAETTASGLVLEPRGGDRLAFTTGATCDGSVAMVGSLEQVARAMPGEGRPTRALGFLDARHLLVAVGGCDGPADLWVAGLGGAELIVTGAVAGSARTRGPRSADAPPEDLLGEIREFG